MNNRITIENLTVKYGEKFILRDISFSCKPNEIIGIIGESGSGKSTLIKSLAGFVQISRGKIYLDEQMYICNNKLLFAPWEIRRNIIIVFQDYNLINHMTCMDNICAGLLHVKKIAKNESKRIALRISELFGISHVLDKYPYEISGGEKQRVAVARAIVLKPQILLLDEITSAIDPINTEKISNALTEIRNSHSPEEQTSVLLVTHNLKFARDHCDKILFLHDKRIHALDNTELVFTSPQTEELASFIQKSKYLL